MGKVATAHQNRSAKSTITPSAPNISFAAGIQRTSTEMWKNCESRPQTVQISGVPLLDLEICQLYSATAFSADFVAIGGSMICTPVSGVAIPEIRWFDVQLKTVCELTFSKKFY
jgi:hypothetical protein